MTNPFKLHMLTLEGSPREIGRAHGEQLRPIIQELFQKQNAGFEDYIGMTRPAYLDELFKETQFLQAVEKWTPQALEEVRGIAEGAGLDFRDAFVWQLLDEVDWYNTLKKMPFLNRDPNRCSSMGAFGAMAEPALVAQNADMGKSIDGYGTLLHVKYRDNGFEKFTLTIPGVIGIWGINNHGVGVSMNAMETHMKKSRLGLGTVFVAQGILAQNDFGAADRFIRNVKHASGENYVIGATGIAADYECSANQVVRYIPFDGSKVVYHSNHPVVNNDLDLTPELIQSLPTDLKTWVARATVNTETRFNSLEARLKERKEPLTVAEVKKILSSHDTPDDPICRHRRDDQNGMTNFSFIMEFGSEPRIHIASGPPCMTEFRTFNFRDGLENWTNE
jgi:isopenicillin-N N-acyltransferase like protein